MARALTDTVPHAAYCFRRLLGMSWNTVRAYAAASWWGVRMARHCRFGGAPSFYRHPGSHICIGSSCRFISSSLYNRAGVSQRCLISTLCPDARIEIGSGCGFSGTVIAAAHTIRIGDRVRVGANAVIMDTDWHTDDFRSGVNAPVCIEDDVWLGMYVTVLKGVTIGRGTLVGAHSLVTRSLPGHVVAAGSPAKILRTFTAEEISRLEDCSGINPPSAL